MLPFGKPLFTKSEETIVQILGSERGLHKTSTDLVDMSGGKLQKDTVLKDLENLQHRGFVRSNFRTPLGYQVPRRFFELDSAGIDYIRNRAIYNKRQETLFIPPGKNNIRHVGMWR